MTASESDFLEFLIEAKKATYAGQGDDASVKPLLEGSKQLEFKRCNYLYRDVYFGMSFFVGQETVYFNNQPLWSMAYSGGISTTCSDEQVREIYSFLRKAMRQITPLNPYRGPTSFRDGDFVYSDTNEGAIQSFQGKEKITRFEQEVYSLCYSGGFLR